MQDKPNAALSRESFSTELDKNTENLKTLLNAPVNEDARFREFSSGRIRVCAVYMEGMADEDRIADFVFRAIQGADAGKAAPDDAEQMRVQGERLRAGAPQTEPRDGQTAAGHAASNGGTGPNPAGAQAGSGAGPDSGGTPPPDIHALNAHIVEVAQTEFVGEYAKAVSSVVAGMTCLICDGSDEALILETRNYPHRSVEKPSNEAVVSGAHEAFNEHLRTNISLVRRYAQSPELITQKLDVGTKVPTKVALMYLNGVARAEVVSEVKRRLKCVSSATVRGTGELQQLIEDRPFTLLPQILQTERPDRAAAGLENGQVILLVENSPYALLAPVTLYHLVHASDDSFLRWQYASFLRAIRMGGIFLSLLLSPLYIALTLYHTHLIPMSLLTSIAESRANVPFPVIVEVLIMEFSFYLLNEAGTRIPSQIGSALGIVGALVLGQAAVSASIISPILIIVIALTGLGNYAIPTYGFGLGVVLYRLFLSLMAGLFGLYGISIGLFLIVVQLCSVKSFGVDYLAPVSPWRRHNPDILLRLPSWLQKHVTFFAAKDSWMRGKEADK